MQKLLPSCAGIAEKFLAKIPRHFEVYFVKLPMRPMLNYHSFDDFRIETGENHGRIDFLTGKFSLFPWICVIQ